MKLLSLILFILTLSTSFYAQIGINTSSPDVDAALDIRSTTKGLLIPRTSTITRLAMNTTAKGMMVYDTTTSSFWYHNGINWNEVASYNNVWKIDGNTGNTASNFIGTTDNQPILFKVNDGSAGIIDSV